MRATKTFVEQTLTARIGEAGKKLHTARSRNDQVALDMRMYVRASIDTISQKTATLCAAICDVAEANRGVIMSGYTHLQRAQPILFAHHLMAYCMMFLRDISRLADCRTRLNVSPIGSCALAGTTYPIDRRYEADLLGFDSVAANSIDGVSDRDYLVELLSALSLVMVHLSRLAEELILWSSWEFGYIRLSDRFTTGSSIMPQKKNADMAELCRGKTGRVFGDLTAMLTVLKGLPLAYNKDMQEDKECTFDAIDTVTMCLDVCAPMIRSMEVRSDRMAEAAKQGFINATDLADYLVCKGMPFRTAYRVVGGIVADCTKAGLTLEELTLAQYKTYSELFDEDVYAAIDMMACVDRRISEGGTSQGSVDAQLGMVRAQIKRYIIK